VSRSYLVALRHTDKARVPACPTFIVPTYDRGRAVIMAADRYRATFGPPERGLSHGISWVNCDFLIERTARYIPLTDVSNGE
jgi:hypothetical protein